MLNIATVNVGDYRGCGERYVNTLRSALDKHLTVPFRFTCITEGGGGWYEKMQLFGDLMFPRGERVVYLDLDTMIVGNIDWLATYQGPFAALQDFYRENGIGSGVMAWEAGTVGHIWTAWWMENFPKHGLGDQGLIERYAPKPCVLKLQELFPGEIASFKVHCWSGRVPPGTSLICFHGEPKMDNCEAQFVKDYWERETYAADRIAADVHA